MCRHYIYIYIHIHTCTYTCTYGHTMIYLCIGRCTCRCRHAHILPTQVSTTVVSPNPTTTAGWKGHLWVVLPGLVVASNSLFFLYRLYRPYISKNHIIMYIYIYNMHMYSKNRVIYIYIKHIFHVY